MAKTRDIVNQTIADLTAQLKEIKQSDEDDLGTIAQSFDEIAARADQTATILQRADQALSGEDEEEPDDEGDEEPDEDEGEE